MKALRLFRERLVGVVGPPLQRPSQGRPCRSGPVTSPDWASDLVSRGVAGPGRVAFLRTVDMNRLSPMQ